jgi:hypothetical protein
MNAFEGSIVRENDMDKEQKREYGERLKSNGC